MKTIITQLPNRKNYRMGRFSVEIGYPWFTWGAIMEAELCAKSEHNVLELGCGGSTIFFSKRCKSVRSYESSREWVEKVKVALPSPSNVDFVVGGENELIDAVRKEPDGHYDWLIADIGISYQFRLKMMQESVSKLRSGGIMVVDNYDYMPFDYTGWDVYNFDDIGYHGRGTRVCIKP